MISQDFPQEFPMRHFLASLSLLAFSIPGFTADEKSSKSDPKADPKTASLGIGDPAPPVKATKWMQGKEVRSFAPGKVYVVEFWATWCGPCIVVMPHVSDLQDEYRDKGVTIIGFSAKDPNNTEEKVASFVEKRGKKLHYTLAYANDRETRDAYMKAAKQSGIPCCFVVDKAGKIAFIGHPSLLSEVLPKVVAGTWKGKADAKAVEKSREDFGDVRAAAKSDPEAGLKAFDAYRAKWPNMANSMFYATFKLSMLLKLERFPEAKAEAERLITVAKKKEDGSGIGRVVSMFVATDLKLNKELQSFAVRSAEDALKLNGDKDVSTLLLVADAHFAAGDKAKAKAFGAKALDAAEVQQKSYVETRLKKYSAEEKGS